MKYKNWQLLLGGFVIAGVSALITARLMKNKYPTGALIKPTLTQAEADVIAKKIGGLERSCTNMAYTAEAQSPETVKANKARAEILRQQLKDAGYKFDAMTCSAKLISTALTQAQADAIAKQYSDFIKSGNAETMQFPTGSQLLIIKLNEAGYYLASSPLGAATLNYPSQYSYSAVYKGKIVHQIAGYKYSDEFTLETKK